jgi:hypothetical protein
MDFFQRLGNFFTGKGWVNDDEKRRREQQVQPQPQQSQPQQVQQPQLNGQPRMNMPWANNSGGLNQSSQPKVNLNPLQQANQVNQQLNLNSQNNQQKPLVTTNDAPKMLTPEGQQEWANKQNKQIQIQNAVNQPIQQQRPQPVQQQPQPQTPKPVPVQPQQPRPQTITSPNVINQQNDMRRMGIDPNPVHTAIQHANDELNQYRTAQSNRQDIIDNKMRARGVSEPEIAKSRQTRIQLENQARASADEARRSQNMANMLKPIATVAQPIDNARRAVVKGMDNVNKWIDSSDDKEGFQINSPGDYLRFGAKLIPGMVQGTFEAPEKLGAAVSGQRMTEDGRVENINGMQRIGSAADGAIDIFGVPFGASGQLIKSAFKQGGKQVAKEAADQVARKRILSAVKNIVGDAAKEGAEETVQSLAGDLADDGKMNTDPMQHLQAGAFGALGGAMMGTSGKAISALRNRSTNTQTNQSADVPNITTTAVQGTAQAVRPSQQQTPGKLEQEALAQRQARQSEQQQTQQAQPQVQNQNTNQNAGYSDFYRRPAENTSLRQAAEVNAVNTRTNQTHPIQQVNANQTVQATMPNASPALKQAVSQNISDIQHGDTNAIATRQQTTGKLENYLVEQATQNVQNTVAQDVRYKLNNTQQSAIDYRLSQDYVAPGDPKAKEIAEYLRKDIEQRRLEAAQARAEGKENFARQIEGMILNQEQTLKEFEQKSLGAPRPAFRGEEIDLDGYRAFNERPTDTDIETDQLIDIASEKIADDLNEALKLAGLNDDIRVEHSTSRSSEANYITFYDDANDNDFTVRIANHYKAYSSGSGDLNITLSDPEIRTFADVADRVHEAFKSFVDTAVNSDTKYKLSPEQEEYFKDSKIRDENGNLKTLYHGTSTDFNQFAPDRIQQGNLGRGFYFTDNKDIADSYADRRTHERGGGRKVVEAFLNVKKPFDLNYQPREVALDYLTHYFSNNGRTNEMALRNAEEFLNNSLASGDIVGDNYNIVFDTSEPEFQTWARDNGYDGLIIPGRDKASGVSGDAVVVFRPEQIKYIDNLNPTDSPDMRYRIDTEAQKTSDTKQDLINRSREVMGDSAVLFADLGTFNGRDIDGFYRDVEGVVYIAEGKPSLNTLNHELVHRVMANVDDRARNSAIDYIVKTNGAENLVTEYRRKGYDIKLDEQGIKIAAEEKLADGFMEYARARAKGIDINILGRRLHIPGEIIAYFERVWQSIRSFAGKADLAKQLYDQMETGKFRGVASQTRGSVEDSLAYKINPESAKDAIARFNSVKNGWRRKTIMSRITPELAQMYSEATGFNVSSNAKLVLTDNAVRHMKNSGHLDGKGRYGIEDANPITDADIADIPLVFTEPDNIKVKGQKGYRGEKIELSKQLDNMHILAVELEQKPNGDFYIVSYYNKSRSPRQAQASGSQGLDADFSEVPTSSRPKRPGEANEDSVANNTQNVNTDPRYKLDQSQNQSKPSAIDNLNNAMDKYRADKQRRQQPLQETINNIQDNPKPKMTKELRQAIDNFIFENIDENLFLENTATDIQGSNGSEWSIPRIHVDDLRHYLGDLTEDLPSAYKRRTGKRDIDTVAQEMGYDDIDSFIDEVTRVAEARRAERERKEQLAEWRRDPDVIEEAQKIVNARHAEEAKKQAEAKRKAEEVKAHNEQLKKQQALDEVLVRGLDEGPRHKIADIVHNASLAVGIDEKTVAKRFAKIAEQKGYDITGERAFLTVDPHAGSMLDENGRLRPIDEIAPNIKEKIKLPGAEHAVPAPTTTSNTVAHNTRQMIYKDENGAYHSFYEYRNIHGKWQRTGQEAVRVTSPLQNKFIDKIRSDKTVNEEAKRAYEDGLAIQYIWRENSKGINAELVSTFDGYMKTGNKKEYRPSDKLVTFNPNKHHIESGRVVDSATGQILGNYIEMTPEGNVTIYAGKKKMNLNMRDIDFSQLKEMKSGAGQTWTTEGVIDRVTGALRRSNSLNYFKSGVNKTKEALMSIMSELPRQANAAAVKEGNAIGERIKNYRKNLIKQAKKHGPLKRQMLQDAVFVIEPARVPRGEKVPSYKERLHAFEEVYGKPAAEALDQYNGFLRAVYKNLLIRQNEIRVALGKDPIMERKDYITHLGELQSSKGAIASMYNGAKNLMSAGDLPTASRKSLPAKLAGRTGLFKPNQKFNQFAMQRVGDVKPIDPFTPLMEYSKIALHNIHMTDAITMNRSLEVAVRAASEARQEFAGKGTNGIQKLADRIDELYKSIKAGEINQEELIQARNKLYGLSRAIGREIDGVKELHKAIKKIDKLGAQGLTKNDVSNLKEATNKMADSLDKMLQDVEFMQQMTDSANGLTQFVGFVQEHANRLAGKTDPFQRTVTDTEPSLARKFTDTVARGLMKQAALSKIVGNVNSAIAQTASMPTLLATTDAKSLLQAFKRKNREAILQKSNALALRYAEDNLSDDTKFEKTMKVAGIPMEFIEKNVIEYTFMAKYNQAINNGLSDADAVRYAERFINDTVTLRDQISTPRAYNRLWMASFLQFSREVSQQNRYVWNQMTGKQKVAFFVNVAIMYNVLEAVTGNKPGADPMGALLEIIADWMDNDEDDDDKDASVQAKLGRTLQKVSSEAISATPIVSGIVNSATTREDRQKLFGKESSLGRYDGTLPIASLLRTTASIKGNLDEAGAASEEGDDDKADAKTKAAMYRALSELPAGNQLKKTIQGLTAAHSGEAKDGNGEVKAEFEKDNPFYLTQGALFGKNAILPVQIENGDSSWLKALKLGGITANASDGIQINMPGSNNQNNQQVKQQTADGQLNLEGLNKKDALSIKKKLKKGDYQFKDGLLVSKSGEVERSVYKKLAESQGESDEAYSNWMKAYNIDDVSTLKKEFKSSNDILNKLENGEKKDDKAKSAVDILMGKHKDLPDWAKERYYKESGYSKEQIEYGAMTTHKEVSLMDNYWRQKAQESSHEELMQALTNGRRKSIVGQMFAKNGIVNKLRAEGYITKQEAKALNAAEFDVDGNRITKEGSGGGGSGRGGSGRGRGRSGVSTASPLISAAVKSINSLSSAAPRANKTSGSGRSIDQIGKNLISRMNTQKQVNAALKQWNGGNSSKKPRVRTTKARV